MLSRGQPLNRQNFYRYQRQFRRADKHQKLNARNAIFKFLQHLQAKKFITDFQVKKRRNVIRRDFIILGGIRHYGNLLLFDF